MNRIFILSLAFTVTACASKPVPDELPTLAILDGTRIEVKREHIEIPKELVEKHKNITLYIDTVFINKMLFMVTISKNIKYRMADLVPNKMMKSYHKAMDRSLQQCRVFYRKHYKQSRIPTCAGPY